MNQYQCYICGYWSWSKPCPMTLLMRTPINPARNDVISLRHTPAHGQRGVEQDIAEEDRLTAEGYSDTDVEKRIAERIANHPVLIPDTQ